MRKQTLFIIILSLVLATVLSPGCSIFGQVTATGNVISKLYSFTDFTDIEIGSSFEIEVVPLNSYSVSISAHENLFDYVNISQSGKTLKIGMKPISYTNANLKATITLPILNRLNLSGASHGSARGFTGDQTVELNESGASQLDLDIEAGTTRINLSGASILTGRLLAADIEMEISGASRVDLNGSAADLALNVSGASQANLPEFAIRNADVTLSGASQAAMYLSGKLDAELTGASTLDYTGSPALGKINVTGASKLTK